MAQNKFCRENTIHFQFEMPINKKDELFCGNLMIEGFGCFEHGRFMADIDSVLYENTEIKPVLELMGGMFKIDNAAMEHVKELFKETQLA